MDKEKLFQIDYMLARQQWDVNILIDENVKFVEMNKGFANYRKNNSPIVGKIICQITEKNNAKQPKNMKPHDRKGLIKCN